jgi:hypothetical protein
VISVEEKSNTLLGASAVASTSPCCSRLPHFLKNNPQKYAAIRAIFTLDFKNKNVVTSKISMLDFYTAVY